MFLVLGKPIKATQGLPVGFDIGLRGMCVGESRRISLPSSLSLEVDQRAAIDPKRTVVIKKGQPIQIDATLVSINGLT
jgi:FKBP-type peptidyl-prolyl cis-trans isomerase